MSLILLHQFLLLVLLAPFLLAAPSSIQKRSFKVERVRNPNFSGRNGPRELLRAYERYHMPIPQDLVEAVKADGNGRRLKRGLRHDAESPGVVAATPALGDVEYISPIKVGGQTINVALDTGSADLWLFSSQLPAEDLAGHQVYDPAKSPSFKPMPGANFSILYGDGTSAAGDVGTDTVDVGGVTVTSQAVQVATAVSQGFVTDTHSNGLLGLGFSQLSTVWPTKPKTFFENVMPSLAQPLFTADLPKDSVGAFEFGGIDKTKFVGHLSWIPANTSEGFWMFGTAGFAVGKDSAGFRRSSPARAIADTGTTLMLLSKAVFEGYYSQVPGAQDNPSAGGVTFPCNATLPDLFLDVGGAYTARIPGADINFAKFTNDLCFGGIQRTMSELEIWGDIFFRSHFVVFHGGNLLLGMAQLA